jgi:aldehyde:ferredoxin oxidoreductase
MNNYKDIKPGSKPLKQAYVALMLWFVGRAIEAAARVDGAVKAEFDGLPPGFTFSLGVMPQGPTMIVGKDDQGLVRYRGWDPEGQKIDLKMKIKNLEGAILMFTFQESTAMATARNRLIVDGEVPAACAIVRVLDIVEVYLLPKPIAKLAVKRYPDWSFGEKIRNRIRIYAGAVLGL